MAFSKFASFVGIAKETTPGTPVAATAFIPATGTPQPEDVRNYVSDEGMRGSAVDSYNQIPTQGTGTYELDGNVYLDTIGYPLKAVLGAEDSSGSGPYVHKFGVLNTGTYQPPTYTISDYNGNNTRQFPYAVCSQVEFTFAADGLLSYTSAWTTFPSQTTSKPTQTYGAKTANAGYLGVLTVGGTQALNIESGTLTIARDVSPILGITGSQTPIANFGGAVSATGQFTAVYDSNAETNYLANMISGTSTTFEAQFTNGADSLDFKCTKMLMTKAPIARGSNYIEITVDFTGVANTTDANTAGGGYSPIAVTLTNTTSTAY